MNRRSFFSLMAAAPAVAVVASEVVVAPKTVIDASGPPTDDLFRYVQKVSEETEQRIIDRLRRNFYGVEK